MGTTGNAAHREPWNKGKIVGQKAPFNSLSIVSRSPARTPVGSDNFMRCTATLEPTHSSSVRQPSQGSPIDV